MDKKNVRKSIKTWLAKDCKHKDALIIFNQDSEVYMRNLRSGEVFIAMSIIKAEDQVLETTKMKYDLSKTNEEGTLGKDTIN